MNKQCVSPPPHLHPGHRLQASQAPILPLLRCSATCSPQLVPGECRENNIESLLAAPADATCSRKPSVTGSRSIHASGQLLGNAQPHPHTGGQGSRTVSHTYQPRFLERVPGPFSVPQIASSCLESFCQSHPLTPRCPSPLPPLPLHGQPDSYSSLQPQLNLTSSRKAFQAPSRWRQTPVPACRLHWPVLLAAEASTSSLSLSDL